MLWDALNHLITTGNVHDYWFTNCASVMRKKLVDYDIHRHGPCHRFPWTAPAVDHHTLHKAEKDSRAWASCSPEPHSWPCLGCHPHALVGHGCLRAAWVWPIMDYFSGHHLVTCFFQGPNRDEKPQHSHPLNFSGCFNINIIYQNAMIKLNIHIFFFPLIFQWSASFLNFWWIIFFSRLQNVALGAMRF